VNLLLKVFLNLVRKIHHVICIMKIMNGNLRLAVYLRTSCTTFFRRTKNASAYRSELNIILQIIDSVLDVKYFLRRIDSFGTKIRKYEHSSYRLRCCLAGNRTSKVSLQHCFHCVCMLQADRINIKGPISPY
jgi:hypothetical protein